MLEYLYLPVEKGLQEITSRIAIGLYMWIQAIFPKSTLQMLWLKSLLPSSDKCRSNKMNVIHQSNSYYFSKCFNSSSLSGGHYSKFVTHRSTKKGTFLDSLTCLRTYLILLSSRYIQTRFLYTCWKDREYLAVDLKYQYMYII